MSVALMVWIHDKCKHFAGCVVVDAVGVTARTDRRISHDYVGPGRSLDSDDESVPRGWWIEDSASPS